MDNGSLLTRIDDVSGEHGRYIRHEVSHLEGTDIDAYHFYTFPGAIRGVDNYTLLRSNVVAALNGDAAAKTRVTNWVTASRAGIAALIQRSDVRNVYYDTATGTWNAPNKFKMGYDEIHDTHIHVRLHTSLSP